MIIYADILIVLNAYVDYMLIYSAEKLFRHEIKLFRRLLGAFVGALTSLTIFIPIESDLISFSIGIISSILISIVAFGFKSVKITAKCCLTMYILSCTYSGIMFILWRITQNNSIIINNNIVYLNISPLFLIISTVVCYAVISFASRILSRRRSIPKCNVDITLGDHCVSLRAMVDTGNTLYDSLSGLAVIIIDEISAYSLLGVNLNEIDIDTLISLDLSGYRLIPCTTAAGKCCLPAFRPDNIMLSIDGEYSFIKAYIAVSNSKFSNEFSAIIGAHSITEKETLLCC